MNILNRINNKVSNIKSKWGEDLDVELINKQIQQEKDVIDIEISKIGEFYWNLYAKNEIDVPENIIGAFREIEKHVVNIKDLKIQIENRKVAGTEERIQIDILTKEKEERIAAKKDEHKRLRKNKHFKDKVVEENISKQIEKWIVNIDYQIDCLQSYSDIDVIKIVELVEHESDRHSYIEGYTKKIYWLWGLAWVCLLSN